MERFENKVSSQGIHYTRYIASYTKIASELGRKFHRRGLYRWLMAIGLEEPEAREIANLADNGKLELEEHARKWIEDNYPYDRRNRL